MLTETDFWIGGQYDDNGNWRWWRIDENSESVSEIFTADNTMDTLFEDHEPARGVNNCVFPEHNFMLKKVGGTFKIFSENGLSLAGVVCEKTPKH